MLPSVLRGQSGNYVTISDWVQIELKRRQKAPTSRNRLLSCTNVGLGGVGREGGKRGNVEIIIVKRTKIPIESIVPYRFCKLSPFIFYVLLYALASGFDFTVREDGLQVDQPPEIGNVSTVRIIITKNDNAEGIIEFDPQYISLQGGLTFKLMFKKMGLFPGHRIENQVFLIVFLFLP